MFITLVFGEFIVNANYMENNIDKGGLKGTIRTII